MKTETAIHTVVRKRILGICLILALLLCVSFSGCSSIPSVVFDSSMDVSTDESGTRTITVSFPRSTIRSIFGSKNVSLQSFLDTQVPDELTWNCVEASSRYDLTFTLSFSSLEKYQELAESLSGDADSVSLTRPEVGVSTGFTLTQQNDTVALFHWLAEAFASRSRMSESTIFSLFTDGKNTFTYAGRDMEQTGTGLYVYVENLLDAEEIDLYTDYQVGGNWKRTVRIVFPKELQDNAPNVKNYLSALLPEGVSEEWEDDTTWVITFPEGTPAQIGALMQAIFQSKDTKILSEQVSCENVLHMYHDFTEPLHVSFFAPEAGETDVHYYVSGLPGTVTVADSDGNYAAPPAAASDSDYAAIARGYLCLFSGTLSDQTLTYRAEVQYQPPEILSEITYRAPHDISRVITFRMGADIPKIHRTLMADALQERISSSGSLSEELTDHGITIIRFSQSGTEAQLADGFSKLTGGSSTLSFERGNGHILDRRLPIAASVSEDYTAFLPSPEDTILTVSVSLPERQTFDAGTSSLVQIAAGGIMQVSAAGTRPNPLRPWLIALFVLIALIILFLILTGPVRSALIRRRKARRGPQKRTSAGAKSASGRPGQKRGNTGSSSAADRTYRNRR